MQKEARVYLLMIGILYFALAISGIFVSLFIWNLDQSFTLLALHSLAYSIAILASFPVCAWYARITSPMACSRVGILLFVIYYGLILFLRENSVNHVLELGTLMGLGTSFFVVGMHMQTLDCTEDNNRDRFLYIQNILISGAGMLAPVVSGFIIYRFDGMKGYYIVFTVSFIAFLLAALVSLQIKGKRLPDRSYFKEVWRNPTREWRGMFWVSVITSTVEGTYTSFLVTIMTFSILQNELSLGGYNTFASLIGVLSSVLLAKISRPDRRKGIFAIGAILIAFSSIWLSLSPEFWTLVIYAILSMIGFNLIQTTMNAWTYASYEMDKQYESRRLDYVVVREIPLGAGRIAGIGLFFLLEAYVSPGNILALAFALFGSVFILLIPAVNKIWSKGGMRAL